MKMKDLDDNNIVGTSTSKISRNLLSSQLDAMDLFLESQQILLSVDDDRKYDWHNQTLENYYQSKNIDYGFLSNSLLIPISTYLGFKSMAWESSADYSLTGHVHNYSNVEITSFYEKNTGDLTSIVAFKTRNHITQMNAPGVIKYYQPDPYIGQLKFLAVQNIPAINCNSSNFDGWVYPDGREISKYRFSQAYDFFGDAYGTASVGNFKLPNISNFLKFVQPKTTGLQQNLTEIIQENKNIKLISHRHRIDNLKINGMTNIDFYFIQKTSNGGTSSKCHGVKCTKEDNEFTFTYQIQLSNLKLLSDNIKTSENGNPNGDVNSPYTTIPVLMYIGTH